MEKSHPLPDSGFVRAFSELFGSAGERFAQLQDPARGPSPKLSAWQLLASMVYHALGSAGDLSARARQLFGVDIKDSSLSERRQRIGLAPFRWLMENALRPIAEENHHVASFYQGMRLCGIDGTSWSVTNTPQILKEMGKATARRAKAAFAKLQMCALVELGTHNPLAASVGLKGEGEWALAEQVLGRLPAGALLIVDRLYGCGEYVEKLVAACATSGGELLVRGRSNIKVRVVETLRDSSALVAINLRKQGGGKHVRGEVRVREIRARVRKPGGRQWTNVRLWTTLLDAEAYPAMELVELYARRWEQEIFYKELKIEMRGSDVLRSHTPETAAQEVATLLMAASLMALERARAASVGELQPLRISFVKTLEKIGALWEVLAVSEGLLDEDTKRQMIERIRESIARESIPKRRSRSCPRKVRQPVGGWPRLLENDSREGDYSFQIVSLP